MKIRRVLIYEGPEADVLRTLQKSIGHGEREGLPFLMGWLRITEVSCEAVEEEDAPAPASGPWSKGTMLDLMYPEAAKKEREKEKKG